MKTHLIEREQRLSKPPEEVFPFFSEALNLERLTPAWLHFHVLSIDGFAIKSGTQAAARGSRSGLRPPLQQSAAWCPLREGTLIRYRLRLRGLPIRWLTRIEEWHPAERFVDTQLRGPYRLWHHTHTFEPDGGGTLMRDTVRYAMRAGPVGNLLQRALVESDLDRIFDYRRDAVAAIFG